MIDLYEDIKLVWDPITQTDTPYRVVKKSISNKMTLNEVKQIVDDIIKSSKIAYSCQLDNSEMDENIIENTFFIQIDEDDNSHFSIFMVLYKTANPNLDLSWWDSIDEPMESTYSCYDNEKYSKDELTKKLMLFLKSINAVYDEELSM